MTFPLPLPSWVFLTDSLKSLKRRADSVSLKFVEENVNKSNVKLAGESLIKSSCFCIGVNRRVTVGHFAVFYREKFDTVVSPVIAINGQGG